MNWKKIRISSVESKEEELEFSIGQNEPLDDSVKADRICRAVKTLFSKGYDSKDGARIEAYGEDDGKEVVLRYDGNGKLSLCKDGLEIGYDGMEIRPEFFVTDSSNAFKNWSKEVEGLLNPLFELYGMRMDIYEAFESIPSLVEDRYHESSIRDSIDINSSIVDMANYTNAFVPLYKEDLARLEEKHEELKRRLDQAVRAYEIRKSYDLLSQTVLALRQKIISKKAEVANAQKQIEYILGLQDTDNDVRKKLEELEGDEEFYIQHDQKERKIIELSNEVEDLKKMVGEYKTERRSLESVARSNREQNDKLPKDLDARYASLEKEYDECVENEKLFQKMKLRLVEIDEAAEQSEAAEGIYYSSLDQLEEEKETASKERIDELQRQVESDRSCWMAQHEYVESLRGACVRDLERFGVKDFQSVRAKLPRLLAENARIMEEKRREGSIVGADINKRDFANKGIHLMDIRVPQIDEQLKLLDLNIKDHERQISSLRKSYEDESKGKEFLSHQDFLKSIDRERRKIEEHDNVLGKNKKVCEDLRLEIGRISNDLKEKEDELSAFFDVPDLPLSNLSIEVNSIRTSLREVEGKILTIGEFLSACERFIEISSVYLSSYKSNDRLVMTLEGIVTSKKVDLKGDGFKKSLVDYILKSCDDKLADVIYQSTGRKVDFKSDGLEIEVSLDGVRVEGNGQDDDFATFISCMRKSMFMDWLYENGLVTVKPLFCCVVDFGNHVLPYENMIGCEGLSDVVLLGNK